MLRIIAGQWRHRLLKVPPSSMTRPTTDRTREALFNILIHSYGFEFEGKIVADLFAGSGALGLESLSRGASCVYFFEKDPRVLSILIDNIQSLNAGEKSRLIKTNLPVLPAALQPLDLVFLDPPYQQALVEPSCEALQVQGWLKPETLLCIETSLQDKPEKLRQFRIDQQRVYGHTVITFCRP